MSSLYQTKILQPPNQPTHTPDPRPTDPKPTASFSSKQQRFTRHKGQRSPGPGSYEYKSGNYRTPEYHVQRSKESPVKREHQWIWGSGRESYLGGVGERSGLGPGSYEVGGLGVAGVGRHTNWGKSERFYFSTNGSSIQSMPGPGAYQSQKKTTQKSFASVFKSKSPRTYIQKLISQSSAPENHRQIQQFIQNPEIKAQAEEKRNQKQKLKASKVNQSSFGSKMPRFAEFRQVNGKVGPGSYQVELLNVSKSKQRLPKILIVKDQQRRKKIIKSIPQLPGPGTYQQNTKTIQKSIEQKRSIIIPTEPRFPDHPHPAPGPGHYMRNKNPFQAELERALKLKYSPEKPSFNSSSMRVAPQLPTKGNPLCSYNLEYFDLQYRVKKNLQHLEKLRIMEVTLPAFNSKAKR